MAFILTSLSSDRDLLKLASFRRFVPEQLQVGPVSMAFWAEDMVFVQNPKPPVMVCHLRVVEAYVVGSGRSMRRSDGWCGTHRLAVLQGPE